MENNMNLKTSSPATGDKSRKYEVCTPGVLKQGSICMCMILESLPEQKLFAEEIVLKEVDHPSETNEEISLISTCCQSTTTSIFARQIKQVDWKIQKENTAKLNYEYLSYNYMKHCVENLCGVQPLGHYPINSIFVKFSFYSLKLFKILWNNVRFGKT